MRVITPIGNISTSIHAGGYGFVYLFLKCRMKSSFELFSSLSISSIVLLYLLELAKIDGSVIQNMSPVSSAVILANVLRKETSIFSICHGGCSFIPRFFISGFFLIPLNIYLFLHLKMLIFIAFGTVPPSVSFKKARKRDSFVLINQQLSQPTMSSVGNLDESLTSNYSLLPQKGIAGVPWRTVPAIFFCMYVTFVLEYRYI